MTQKTGISGAFSQVASATFLSRILGLVREQVFAHLFGASMAADAFFAAFRIPNLLRDLFAEGALSSAFVPVFKRELKGGGKETAFELAQVCFSVLTIIVGIIVVAGIFLSPFLVKIITPGFEEVVGKNELTARLTAIMFPFLLLVALAALVMSILNSFDQFAIPALAPALFNLGTIAAAYFICPYLDVPIIGMAIGVLLGGAGQLIIQLPSLFRLGFRFRFLPYFTHRGMLAIGRLITPMIGGLAAGRVNIFVNTLLASVLAAGSVSYLSYSYRIMHLPLGIIGVALGTVALPKASALAADNDSEGLASTFYRAIQLCFFLVLPVAAFFVICGDDVISLLYQHGRFNATDTYNTYQALIWYSVGLIGFAGVRVTAPIYYAYQNAVKPMHFSIASVVVNLAANFTFIPFLGFAGLALATGLGGLVNFGLLLYYLPRVATSIHLKKPIDYFSRSLFSSLFCGVLLYIVKQSDWLGSLSTNLAGRIEKVFILMAVGAAAYFLASFVLKNIPRLPGRKNK